MIDPSMKRKFFLQNLSLFLILLFIPSLLMGSVAVHMLQGYIRKNLDADTFLSLRQVATTVDLVFEELEPLQLAYGLDGQNSYTCKKLLNSKTLDYTDITVLATISGQLSSLVNARSYIHSIYIYFENPSGYFLSNTGKERLDRHPDGEWFSSCIAEGGSRGTHSVRRSVAFTSSARQDVVSVIYRAGSHGSTIVFNLLPDYIERETTEMLSGTGHTAVVLNKDGIVLFGSPEELTEDARNTVLKSTDQGSSGSFDFTADGNRSIVHAFRSGGGFRYVLISSEDAVFGPYKHLLAVVIGMLAVSVVLGFLLALLFTERRTKQVYDIVRLFQAAETGKTLPSLSMDRSSTFGYIINNIVEGFIRQSFLQTQLEARKYKLETAQLMALQAQLNPHFLFNTLETMNWSVYRLSKKATLVNDMIECLSLILRYALASPEEPVTLADEIRHVEYYLRIQGYRYQNKFTTEWMVPDECLLVEVPRLSLQPIIENALYHGLKPKSGDGRILVSATAASGMVTVTVRDDGVGMDRAALDSLRERIQDPDLFRSDHLGLRNLNARLMLAFGCSLRIESAAGEGTQVSFEVPKGGSHVLAADR